MDCPRLIRQCSQYKMFIKKRGNLSNQNTYCHHNSNMQLLTHIEWQQSMKERRVFSANRIFVILLIIGLIGTFTVAATVELVDCPECHNDIFVKYFCSYCDGDGKVTISKYLTG